MWRCISKSSREEENSINPLNIKQETKASKCRIERSLKWRKDEQMEDSKGDGEARVACHLGGTKAHQPNISGDAATWALISR